MRRIYTPADVNIYQTLEGTYRAYLRDEPNYQVWSSTYHGADSLMREKFSKDERAFDWTTYNWDRWTR
jgi:hypothetical protein